MDAVPAEIILRPYRPEDLPALLHLFAETVRRINAADYTKVQLDAWISCADPAQWGATLQEHDTWVALLDNTIAGFGDMDATGYLDRLFVRWDCQHRGVATALCQLLEQRCPSPRVTVHASITARPFFARRGYQVIQTQAVTRRGVQLQNFSMEKWLHFSG